jgi:predicted O-methyltransferase YrrM
MNAKYDTVSDKAEKSLCLRTPAYIWVLFVIQAAVFYGIGSTFGGDGNGPIGSNGLNCPFAERTCPESADPLSLEVIRVVLDLYHETVKFWDVSYRRGHDGITAPNYNDRKTEFVANQVQLAKKNGLKIKNICEVGFMAGASSVLFMLLAPEATWYGFDYAGENRLRTVGAGKFLERARPGKAFFILGDSTKTVPEFHSAHPDVKCDLVLVDGAKSDLRYQDIQNLRAMSHKDTLMLLDEVSNTAYVKGGNDNYQPKWGGAERSYHRAVKDNLMTIPACIEEPFPAPLDSFCTGKFKY